MRNVIVAQEPLAYTWVRWFYFLTGCDELTFELKHTEKVHFYQIISFWSCVCVCVRDKAAERTKKTNYMHFDWLWKLIVFFFTLWNNFIKLIHSFISPNPVCERICIQQQPAAAAREETICMRVRTDFIKLPFTRLLSALINTIDSWNIKMTYLFVTNSSPILLYGLSC